jgi:hypothetical protein
MLFETTLQEFTWVDSFGPHLQLEAVQSAALDPVIRALPACLHLREFLIHAQSAGTGAMKNLLHVQSALGLVLEKEHWLAVADEIRYGRWNVLLLCLSLIRVTKSEAASRS